MITRIVSYIDKEDMIIYEGTDGKTYQSSISHKHDYLLDISILISVFLFLLFLLGIQIYIHKKDIYNYLNRYLPSHTTSYPTIGDIDLNKRIYMYQLKPNNYIYKFKHIRIWHWDGGKPIDKDKLEETILYLIDRLDIQQYLPSLHTHNFKDLILETCAVESNLGSLIKQVNGPALSIYQIEPNTYNFIDNLLKTKYKNIHNKTKYYIDLTKPQMHTRMTNIPHATVACMVYYLYAAGDKLLSNITTREQRANIWKIHYNTHLGKGTVESYLQKSKLYLGEEDGKE